VILTVKNCENWLIFDDTKAYAKILPFLDHPVHAVVTGRVASCIHHAAAVTVSKRLQMLSRVLLCRHTKLSTLLISKGSNQKEGKGTRGKKNKKAGVERER